MATASEHEIPNESTSAALLNQQETSPIASSCPAIPDGAHDGLRQIAYNDIHDPEWRKQGLPDTEFNRKYPPDAWGEEASRNARVWKIYRDEQSASDKAMLASWNKTLDVLLIFAGLFSAVSTAFIIESYKALQPDYTQYIATFLYAAAATRNRTGGVLPPLDALVHPDTFVQISSPQRWTNGLWFSSLVLSLAVALLCILVKQWLDEYDRHILASAPSHQYWSRRHHLYRDGLQAWGVPALISFLPILLHLSLFLFFAGLAPFLHLLDGTIAYVLIAVMSWILLFYIVALILPAWRVECPSYTPLLSQLRRCPTAVLGALHYLAQLPESLFQGRFWQFGMKPAIIRFRSAARRAAARLQIIRTLREDLSSNEKHVIYTRGQELDGRAISTLLRTTNGAGHHQPNSYP